MKGDSNDYGIEWFRRPEGGVPRNEWRILRAPTTGSAQVLVYSHDLIYADTHYYNGRTVPHKKHGCKPCEQDSPRRGHCWFAGVKLPQQMQVIVELTQRASGPLIEAFNHSKTLRGLQIEIKRTSPKQNGKVFVRTMGWALNADKLPRAPAIPPILARMWQIKDLPLIAMSDDATAVQHSGDGLGQVIPMPSEAG